VSSESRVVFIDDDDDLRRATAQMLELGGFAASVFSSAKQALPEITSSFPGVVATDIRMPDMNGLQLFERVRAIDPELPVILTTGHGDIDLAVAAMKDGAYDFITKPFIPGRLTEALRRGIEKRELVLENRNLHRAIETMVHFSALRLPYRACEKLYTRSPTPTLMCLLRGRPGQARRLSLNSCIAGAADRAKRLWPSIAARSRST
jgi:DNA-binding NtrC family response regulator